LVADKPIFPKPIATRVPAAAKPWKPIELQRAIHPAAPLFEQPEQNCAAPWCPMAPQMEEAQREIADDVMERLRQFLAGGA
jgi:hypothetical protein